MHTHSEPAVSQRDFLRVVLVAFAAWTIFGAIAFLQLYSNLLDGRHSFSLARSLQLGLGNAWLKAALSVPVLWALLLFNVKPRALSARVAMYGVLFAAFTAAHILVRPLVIPIYVANGDGSHYTYWQFVLAGLESFTLDDALAFALTVAGFHSWRYAREGRIRTLREEALRAQLANAELSILKMQLQPHFLFNTLNTISCLAPDNSRKAQQMIERLSRLLRLSLEHLSSNAVPLSRELEFLDAYLDIETTRFGDRLRVVREIDPAVMTAKVPSMMLQPLVENAIRHGVGKMARGGTVQVRAERRGDRLIICIANDCRAGNGFSPGSGLGLANTRARLAQMFGDDYSFQLEKSGGQARVTLEVPFRPLTSEAEIEEATWTR